MSDDLTDRVFRLESRLELFELEGRYSRFFDDHEGDAWSALLTEDGVYQSRDPEGTLVEGRAALKEFCDNAAFDGIHLFHLPQITMHGDTATARIHLEYRGIWPRKAGTPRVDMVGYYDVAYARVDGTWLISRRVTTTFSHQNTAIVGYATGTGLDGHGVE